MSTFLYIDPGTGTILFQMLIAGFVTVLAFSRKVQTFFRNLFANWTKKK